MTTTYSAPTNGFPSTTCQHPNATSLPANFDSSITSLGKYLETIGEPLPTRSALDRWRDDMLREGKAVRTINARLAAARKLLRAVARDSTDLQIKMVLNDWANVADAKATIVQDKTEADYQGKAVTISAHDLRRTYAKLCKSSGTSWEALRENLGHSSVMITENYVGYDVDWTERQPNWSIKLKG